jgi:phosphatidylglycerophosphatase A
MELLPPPGALAWFSPDVLLTTWFGAGLVEPLRAGLAVASVLAIILLARPGRTTLALGTAVLAVAAAVAVASLEARSGIGDDRRIVVDEVLGALVLATLIAGQHRLALAAAAGLFLFVDRWKPWPLDVIEALPQPFGILADDMAAGAVVGLAAFLAGAMWQGQTGRRSWSSAREPTHDRRAEIADTSRSSTIGSNR